MTRSLGLLALIAPVFAIVWLALPASPPMPPGVAAAAIAGAWILGAASMSGALDRAPGWVIQALQVLAPVLIVPFIVWSDELGAGFVLMLVWTAPYAYSRFSLAYALGLTAFTGACFLVARLVSPYGDPAAGTLALETALLVATIVALGLFARALMHSTRRVERTRAWRERILAELGRASLDATRLDGVIENALTSAAGELGAEVAVLAELDDVGELRLTATTCSRWPPGTPVPPGDTTLVRRALAEDVVVTDDIEDDPRFETAPDIGEAGLHAGIAVALHAPGGEPTGAIGVYGRQTAHFARDDAVFLQSLANLVASAKAHFAAEERLRHRALHDPLTGLPNRTLLADRLEQALARARRRSDRQVALILLDLDRFKQVNDSLGHAVGDLLLIAVAGRLEAAVRAEDTLARMGGDEFVMIAEGVDGSVHALELARRLVEALREPLALDGRRLHMSASAGVALAGPATTPDELLANADAAMYHSKGVGQGGAELFDDGMRALGTERLRIEQELHRALERDELLLHYQPIVDPATGATRSVEALVRWQHPRRGLIGPGQFIPAAEATGLIVPLGEQVLGLALSRLAQWRRRPGLEALTVSVNVSIHQLRAPWFVGAVCEALDRAGLPPQALTLEITERVLLDPEGPGVGAAIALNGIGVGLALDDFGTGFSSLSSLRSLPVSTVKVDRAFVAGLGENEADTAVVRGVLAMAHGARVGVVAEGVETPAQAAAVLGLGCDGAQGYYYARPAAPADMEALLTGPLRAA